MSLFVELYRKFIHLTSLWIPALSYYTSKKIAFVVFFTILIFLSFFEYARLFSSSKKIKGIINAIIKFFKIDTVFRKHELTHISGATYMLMSATLCVLLVTKEIFIFAFCVLIISDSLAALTGKFIGKYKILLNKTLEGSIIFFISSLIVMVCVNSFFNLGGSFIVQGILACLVATMVELLSPLIAIDDNISIPVSICFYFIMFN